MGVRFVIPLDFKIGKINTFETCIEKFVLRIQISVRIVDSHILLNKFTEHLYPTVFLQCFFSFALNLFFQCLS